MHLAFYITYRDDVAKSNMPLHRPVRPIIYVLESHRANDQCDLTYTRFALRRKTRCRVVLRTL